MLARRKRNAGRSLLLRGCTLGALGWIAIGITDAQQADSGKPVVATTPAAAASGPGSLDMDVNPAAPPAPTNQSQAGGLDMAVSPATPAPAVATPPASTAGKADIRAMSPDDVQAGARISTINPAPLEAAPPAEQPLQPSIATPPATMTTPGPATAQPEPVNLDHPTVVDTADLKAGDTVISLYGIQGLQGDAVQGLQGFLAATANRLTCQLQPNAGYVCLLPDGTDIAEVALVNGAARAKDDAPDAYRDQEAAAQAARRGIWASLPPPPATVQHPVVQDTATLVANGQTYVLNGIIGLGAPYAAQLQGYIAANGDSLTCEPQIEPGEYICMLGDGTDLAQVALVNGAARIAPDASDSYRAQQLDALNNHRGIWQNPPTDVLIAATSGQPAEMCCTYEAGDEGVDGVTYVGGEPEAVIDGEAVFLVFGGALGWGYYDHWHHWHGAPDRYRHHLERFHPDGHGLRGYGHYAEVRRDVAMHREETLRHDEALHPGLAHPATVGGTMHPGTVGALHPGVVTQSVHPGVTNQGVHPGAVNQGMHPGFASQGVHPGSVGGGSRPAIVGGFVHPGPSAGGFHPNAPTMHASAPVMHAGGSGPPPKATPRNSRIN